MKSYLKLRELNEKALEENEGLRGQILRLTNEMTAVKGLNDRHKDLKDRSLNEMNAEIQNLIEKLDQEREEKIRVSSRLQGEEKNKSEYSESDVYHKIIRYK